MIDLNDEKQKYFYLGKCVSGKPVDFYGEKIYQPTVDEIFEMGEDAYYEFLSPFIVGRGLYNAPDDMNTYECIMNNKKMIVNLIMAINYFLKIDNVRIYECKSLSKKLGRPVNQIILNDRLIIDNNKFEEFKQIILLICNTKEVDKDDVENDSFKCKDSKYNEKVSKLLENRSKSIKKQNEIKKVKLMNVYDYIVHSQSIIDYDAPLKWTIYQIYNTYKNLHIKEGVTFTYSVASNGLLDKDQKLKQLSDEIAK